MKRPIPKFKIIRLMFLGMLFFIVLLNAGTYFVKIRYQDKIDFVTDFPISSQVFDRNGILLYEYYGAVRRIPVEDEQIPLMLKQATLMAEDERFFRHNGIDTIGIIRAFWKNMQADQVVEGASTLGQQLIKNTVLGPSGGYREKLDEALFSMAIDQYYPKNKILNLYINTIPYGSNVYGAEAASRHYFNKSVESINLNEAAILAALPKKPSIYAKDNQELTARRNVILNKMLQQEMISVDQHRAAMDSLVNISASEVNLLAPHFVMYIKNQIEEVFGQKVLEEDGLLIYTTLDYNLQKQTEQIVKNYSPILQKYNADSLGLVMLNAQTGEILTMIGNLDYNNRENAGNFNMTLANRQPGSTFKPFTYAALLEKNTLSPASVVYDVPKTYRISEQEVYSPKNYDQKFRGPVTIRQALAMSLNVPAVQAIDKVGVDNVIDLVQDLGLNTLEERNRYGLSLTLGGAEVRLLEMTGAYAAFANAGTYLEPQSIVKISSIDKTDYPWRTPLPINVLRPETCYQITSILSDAQSRSPVFGVNSPLSFYDRVVAAKTGTTQNYRDAWTIGYTPSLVTALWIGNHDNRPMVEGSAGAVLAGPLWRQIMDEYLQNVEAESFEIPKYLQKMRVTTIGGVRDEYIAPWQIDGIRPLLVKNSGVQMFVPKQ